MSCYRKTGQRDVRNFKAGSALAKGDIVQLVEATGARTVDNAATGAAVLGYTLSAADSAADVLVDILHPGDRVIVTVSAGTVSDTEIGKYADIADEVSITLTESNNDFIQLGWDGKTTTEVEGCFTTLQVAQPTAII